MNIRIKKLNVNATIPTKGSKFAAGYDIKACISNRVEVKPHQTIKIPTGIAMELPIGYAGLIYARSGLATKKGLRLANSVAVIDPDYRGEWFIPLHNDSEFTQVINPSERICQLIVTKFLDFDFCEVSDLSETERGDGGFGHTGTK